MTRPLRTDPRYDPESVVVGLSGGVDSAVAALLLKQRGYRVQALFMKNWEEDDLDGQCAAADDLADAEDICAALDVPLARVNFATEYWDRVFIHFLAEHRAGRTPNPDVLCNQEIKFRAFLEHALALGGERIATGHYARTARRGAQYRLLKGRDPDKDQSYFLYTLGQNELSRSLFPLGEFSKPAVRRLAIAAGLRVHAKKDSTGICFIGERPFRAFLERYLPPQPGDVRDTEGRVLGTHSGLMFYTLGQRKGLGIGGRRDASSAPWFVVEKDLQSNALIVAQGNRNPRLYSRALRATGLSWVAGHAPGRNWECTAKVRYRQTDQACRVMCTTEDACQVVFAEPQRAVTPGQSIVFYRGDECLGGGVIARSVRDPQ